MVFYKSEITGKVIGPWEIQSACTIFGEECVRHMMEDKLLVIVPAPTVKELLQDLRYLQAVLLYQEVHRCNYAAAKIKVDAMNEEVTGDGTFAVSTSD